MSACKKVIACLLLLAPISTVQANDGRDRTREGGLANSFVHFPAPTTGMNGYRVLEKDGPGGADGTSAFRWARPQAVAMVRIAAHETVKALGKAPFPMPIFDLSAENGDTPVDFQDTARGRHPGGSHDGGINLDLGYYLKSEKGLDFQPDLAACSEHFQKKDEKLEDQAQCQGPADKLALAHQAYFLLMIARLNEQYFQGEMLEEIGIDLQVQKLILKELESWQRADKHGAKRGLVDELRRVFVSDEWDGWASSHHHHIHLRLRNLSMFGRHRAGYEALMEREKTMDHDLFRHENRGPYLWARLWSSNMQRSVQADVFGDKAPYSFRSDDKNATAADPSRALRPSASWDLPDDWKSVDEKILVRAEAGKNKLEAELELPQKIRQQSINIETQLIQGRVDDTLDLQTLSLAMPAVYRSYVTKVIYIADDGEIWEGKGPRYAVELKPSVLKAKALVQAKVQLSSRMTLTIPVYIR